MERVCVERTAEDRWRIWPQDETWLPAVTKLALQEDATSVAAVLKEHPQHEGVLLRGEKAALLRAIGALRSTLQAMRRKGLAALRCESYDLANLLRRALLTRPFCLAAEAVHFTMAVADSEYEPIAAHRIGQLTFCVEATTDLTRFEVQLLVPPGEWAFARHLQLPPGVQLHSGQGEAAIGLRAVESPAEGGQHLMAVVELCPNSVFFSKHAKHCAVAAVSYRPEVRITPPFPRTWADTLRKAGFSCAQSGVIDAKTMPCRQEFVAQLLPDAVFLPPRHIQLDFEALAQSRKEAVLDDAIARLLAEIGGVEEQMQQAEVVAESRCPDASPPRTFCTA